MTYLQTVDENAADTDVARMYDADRQHFGYVANFTRTFSPRPAVYAGWQQLNGAIKATMDPRRYELATVAAARRLRSSYCALAHGAILAEQHVGEPAVRDLMADPVAAGLTPLDRAVVALAEKVTDDATGITETDFDDLRGLGLADPEILDVVLAAAARCFFSTVLDATGTLADAAFAGRLSESTTAALTVGRPIDSP
ncbi:carboxymuconolactone decarboxylase family protein [Nakamurella lactea]|uniref:carboxymuconolactone decarboxylase family protein n=1 Tax=Nakamurella lactea TaxID=459515 RepID=UPI000405DDA9|nr:carboxymuconolactone decarboxylase family protein [Nakamurella lactea]